MRQRPVLRWLEAALALVSFSALSLYAIVAIEAASVQRHGATELAELSRAAPVRRALSEGDLIGRIAVPRLGVDTIVLEGVSAETLRVAAGHLPETALPGAGGNAAVAAHRDTFFRGLRGIRAGDRILLTTPRGERAYRVAFTRVVAPSDTSVLAPAAADVLTLITCYPFSYIGPAPQRFVVRALDDTR